MLKEQVINLAMQAIAKAYEKKEEIKKKLLENEAVGTYLKNVKDVAGWIIEQNLAKTAKKSSSGKKSKESKKSKAKTQAKAKEKTVKETKVSAKPAQSVKTTSPVKTRKSSIKPVKDIPSVNADKILSMIKESSVKIFNKNDELEGKKTLAYLVWSLGNAEKAKIKNGISVHDVSSLIYKASGIELYPINISRILKSNPDLVTPIGQLERTKTYLLSDQGKKIFAEKFTA